MTIRFAPSDGHFLEISTARFSKHRLGTTAPMLEEENSAVQQQHPLGTSKTTPLKGSVLGEGQFGHLEKDNLVKEKT